MPNEKKIHPLCTQCQKPCKQDSTVRFGFPGKKGICFTFVPKSTQLSGSTGKAQLSTPDSPYTSKQPNSAKIEKI